MGKKDKRAAAAKKASKAEVDPMLTICPQLQHGTIVTVSGLTRKLNGQMGVVQEQQDGSDECRVRLFKQASDTLILRDNLMVKTSSSTTCCMGLEIWPYNVDIELSRSEIPVGTVEVSNLPINHHRVMALSTITPRPSVPANDEEFNYDSDDDDETIEVVTKGKKAETPWLFCYDEDNKSGPINYFGKICDDPVEIRGNIMMTKGSKSRKQIFGQPITIREAQRFLHSYVEFPKPGTLVKVKDSTLATITAYPDATF